MDGASFLALVHARSSVRRYDLRRPVSDELLQQVLEAARLAPSASNTQPWRFVVVRDPSLRRRLAEECFSGIYLPTRSIEAPLYLALCGVRGTVDRGGSLFTHVSFTLTDCGIAGEHAVLAAAALGLGTCWIGWFNRRRARRLLGVPPGVVMVALIALGWPARPVRTSPRGKGRRPLAALAWLDAWGRPFGGAQANDAAGGPSAGAHSA